MSNPYEPVWPNEAAPSPHASSLLVFLRLAASIGIGIVLCCQASSLFSMEPRQDWGFIVLVLAVPAVGLVSILLLPSAVAKLKQHLDLILPLGLYITSMYLLNALATIPVLASVLSPSWSFKILSLSFSISVAFLLLIALAVAYAGWTPIMILQAVREDRVDPIAAFSSIGKWFWRVLGAETIGWGVLFTALAVGLALAAAALPLALTLLGLFFVIWNLMTAALLPVVFEHSGFSAAIRQGIRVSWTGKSRWWLPVLAQMVLLGFVTFISVSFTSNPHPGSFNMQSKTHYSVNGFWTGGYQNECHWYTDLMKEAEARTLPLIETLLGILFGVLAILVKIKVTTEVYGSPGNDAAGEGQPGRFDTQPI
jgi:hypothetical protein